MGAGYGLTGRAAGSVGHDGFFIDENTFGATFGGNASYNFFNANSNNTALNWRAVWGWNFNVSNTVVIRRITETNAQFAGLCEQCHSPAALINTNSKAAGTVVTHAHRTVKNYGGITTDIVLSRYLNGNVMAGNTNTWNGTYSQQLMNPYNDPGDVRWIEDASSPQHGGSFIWGLKLGNRQTASNGQMNGTYVQADYHQFPCSKCHTPHASRLPRLLKTNCLDLGGTMAGTNNFNNQRHSINATNSAINPMRASTSGPNNWSPARAIRCHNAVYQFNVSITNNTSGHTARDFTPAQDTRWTDVTTW
jgi:hypothetical protein